MDLNDHDAGSFDEMLAEFPAAAATLAESASTPPPPQLRRRTLDAALATRAGGRPAGQPEPAAPADAFAEAVDDLSGLLADLHAGDWDAPALGTWTVRGVIGHLAAVEEYIGARLGLWDLPGEFEQDEDHRAMTEPSVLIAEATDPDQVVLRWHQRALALVEAARRLDDDALDGRVVVHGFSYRWRTLLVARSFELWTHASDIRAALGRPRVDPEVARLRLMSQVAVAALPIGLALTGNDGGGRTARVVLTGPGGGAWTQALDLAGTGAVTRADEAPSVTLVVDAVDFCRVAAQRLSPADLDVTIEGDRALAEDLLVAVAVFSA